MRWTQFKALLMKELKMKKNSWILTILAELIIIPLGILIFISVIIFNFKKIKLHLDPQNFAINPINGGIGFMTRFWGSNTNFECSADYLTPFQSFNKSFPNYYHPLKLCEISNNPILGLIGDYPNFQYFWAQKFTSLYITDQRKPFCDRNSDRGFDFKIMHFSNMNEFDNYIRNPAYKVDEGKSEVRDGICIGIEVNKNNNIYNLTIRYGDGFYRRNFFTDSDLELNPTTQFFSDDFHNDILSLTTFTQMVEGGFIYLQAIMTDYLISSTVEFQNHSTFVFLIPIIDSNKQINYPIYKKMKTFLQYFMGIGFYLVFARICISISQEKSAKLRGIMILKGMKYYLYWLSIFIEYFVLSLLTSSIFSVITRYFVLPNTNFAYIFFMFVLHYMNQLSLAVFSSSFFSSEAISLIFGSSIYFLNMLLGILFESFKFSDWILFWLSVLPPIGGISLISKMINKEILIEEMINLDSSNDASLSNYFIPLFFIMHILGFFIFFVYGILLDKALMYGLIGRPNWRSRNKIGLILDNSGIDNKEELNFKMEIPTFSILLPECKTVSKELKANKSKFNKHETVKKETPLMDNQTEEETNFDNNKLYDEIMNEGARKKNLNKNITLKKGDVFVILGSNGSGKTKLIELVSGLYGPLNHTSKCTILELLQKENQTDFSIGFNSNREAFASPLTVRELLEFYSALSSAIDEDKRDDEIKAILESCGLSVFKDFLPYKLSKGQKTALSVAIALVGNSFIVLLDNPTLDIDPIIQKSLIDYILKIKHEKIIFLATNSMDEAEILGNKFALLDNGKFYLLNSLSSIKGQHSQYILSLESNHEFKYMNNCNGQETGNENKRILKDCNSPREDISRIDSSRKCIKNDLGDTKNYGEETKAFNHYSFHMKKANEVQEVKQVKEVKEDMPDSAVNVKGGSRDDELRYKINEAEKKNIIDYVSSLTKMENYKNTNALKSQSNILEKKYRNENDLKSNQINNKSSIVGEDNMIKIRNLEPIDNSAGKENKNNTENKQLYSEDKKEDKAYIIEVKKECKKTKFCENCAVSNEMYDNLNADSCNDKINYMKEKQALDLISAIKEETKNNNKAKLDSNVSENRILINVESINYNDENVKVIQDIIQNKQFHYDEKKENVANTFELINENKTESLENSSGNNKIHENLKVDPCKERKIEFNYNSDGESNFIIVESLLEVIQDLVMNNENLNNLADQSFIHDNPNFVSLLSVTPRVCKIRIPIENLTHKTNLFFNRFPDIISQYNLSAFELSKQTLDDIYLYIQSLILGNKEYYKKINCTDLEMEESDQNKKRSKNNKSKNPTFYTKFKYLNYFWEMIKKFILTFYNNLFLFLVICFSSLLVGLIMINASTKSVVFEYSEPIQPTYYNYSANPQLFYYTAPPTDPNKNCDNNSTLLALQFANLLKINSNINLVPYPDLNLNPDLEDHINKFISYFQSDSKKMNSYVNGSLLTSFIKIPSGNNFQITCSNNLFIFVNLSNPNSTGLVTSHIFDSLLRFTTNDNARIFFTNYPLPLSSYSKEVMKSKLALIPVFFLVFSLSALHFIILFPFSKEVASGLARMQKLYGGSLPFWITNFIIHTIANLLLDLFFCLYLTIFGYNIVYLYELIILFSLSMNLFSYFMIILFSKSSSSVPPGIIVLLLNIILGNLLPFIFQILQRIIELKRGLEIIEGIFMFLFPAFTLHQGLYHSLEKTAESIYIFPFYSKNKMESKIQLAFLGLGSSILIYSVLIFFFEYFFYFLCSQYIPNIININTLNLSNNKIENFDSIIINKNKNLNINTYQSFKENFIFKLIHGNFFFFFGKNYCGKTSLIDLQSYCSHFQIMNILHKDFLKQKDFKSGFKLIGYSPQWTSVFSSLTVYENIYFYIVISINKIQIIYSELAEFIVQKFGLEKYKCTKVSELSDGITKKLKIAISFIPRKSLIIIDSLTSELDPLGKIYFWKLIQKNLKNERSKIILTSSQINDLVAFSNHNRFVIEERIIPSKLSYQIKKIYPNSNLFKIKYQLKSSEENISSYYNKKIEADESVTYSQCKEYWINQFIFINCLFNTDKEYIFEKLKKTFNYNESENKNPQISKRLYYQKFFGLINGFETIEKKYWYKCKFKIKEESENLFKFTAFTFDIDIFKISKNLCLSHPGIIELIQISNLRNPIN